MPSMVQLSQVGHTLQIPPTRSMLIYPRGIILYYLKILYIYIIFGSTLGAPHVRKPSTILPVLMAHCGGAAQVAPGKQLNIYTRF